MGERDADARAKRELVGAAIPRMIAISSQT